ncbi:hypothetical protein BDV28DRAFT_145922 [Aspergillus coremiiformis]|uniref:Uncharacterized protein n=1 Tax=Aspergillus coremiiformis TaxID=138285 RepID=A0A5N6ZD72_9EURO|nr:hypothetical protein BDV28DRAFT_145922 [Aspergillus coremiiformis]
MGCLRHRRTANASSSEERKGMKKTDGGLKRTNAVSSGHGRTLPCEPLQLPSPVKTVPRDGGTVHDGTAMRVRWPLFTEEFEEDFEEESRTIHQPREESFRSSRVIQLGNCSGKAKETRWSSRKRPPVPGKMQSISVYGQASDRLEPTSGLSSGLS